VVGRGPLLYVVDAGFNLVRRLDLARRTVDTLAGFAPTPNPLPGPPFIENVPTSIRWDDDVLAVTLLSGAPAFLPGFSQVVQVDPDTGEVRPRITGLSSAVDMAPLGGHAVSEGFLTLEFGLNFPAPGPGRLQYFATPDAAPVVLADCLTTPSSMVIDRKSNRVVITELATGRLVFLDLE